MKRDVTMLSWIERYSKSRFSSLCSMDVL